MKALIVYYSWSNGNTQKIAEALSNKTGADIVRIDTAEAYKGSHEEVVEQGQEEVNRGYEPPIKDIDKNIDDYDVIILGTPTWWYTMAPAMRTFLHSHNWSGKTVIPFMTNGGWPGHVIKDMKAMCAGATFACEKEIQFDSTGGSRQVTPESEVEAWMDEVKQIL